MNIRGLTQLLFMTALFAGCNEDGFYEKNYLEAQGKEAKKDDTTETDEDSGTDGSIVDEDKSDNGAGTDPNAGSGSGSGTIGSGTGSENGSGTGSGSGQACTSPSYSEMFLQNVSQQSKIDILWVIDDSGSMGDEQEALAYNFDAFIQSFITKGIDFRMAITTTDTSSSTREGKLKGQILTTEQLQSDEALFLSNFSKYVKVGTDGSGYEKGLRASKGFMAKHAVNFLRPDAYLIVVYVSDEQDDSENTVEYYVNALKGYKSNPGLVKAYSIVNTQKPNNNVEEIGTRYIAATQSLGGQISDIKQDFYSTLLNMGEQLVELVDSFALANQANANSIEVKVNGNAVTEGWSYSSDTFTINFDAQSLPAPGSSIQINYLGVCQ